jgi:hypothetical protein
MTKRNIDHNEADKNTLMRHAAWDLDAFGFAKLQKTALDVCQQTPTCGCIAISKATRGILAPCNKSFMITTRLCSSQRALLPS